MNSIIETLNQSGSQFLQFAWPMLWQSSLLIGLVLALDFLLARKIRASVRYALWLAVLVKLLLPPTLALPTGAAWWLFHAQPVVKTPAIRNYAVTYDTTPLADYVPPSIALPPPAPRKLDGAGWALLATGTVSAALLLWLMIRWWQVARMVRGATLSEELAGLCESVRQQAGLRSKIRLKLVEGRMSPAVCGLFRPVILLPRTLAENLSAAQLRAVLLHEVFHLRRLDVWANCAQALLQIVYWWHPLLWFANARIRRLREEAVDDAVMLALRDEADSYAPTLLEVAKLAFRRPLLSLGLVGIMESRSALRQRIERLVDFRAPRRAGLTLVSLLGILAFTAVAVPMGAAPSASDKKTLPATPTSITTISSSPTNMPTVLIQAEIYRMRQFDFQKLVSDPGFVATRPDEVENFQQFKQLLKTSGLQPIQRPRILTSSGVPAQLYVGNETNSIELECSPVVTNGLIDLATRITMITTIENVMTTNFTTQHTTFENDGGHVFSIRTAEEAGGSNIVVVAIGTEIVTNKSQFQQRLQTIIKRAPAEKLFLRAFMVDLAAFISALKQSSAHPDANTNSPAAISAMAKMYFEKLGVNWESPGGKSISFDNNHRILSVRATQADLRTIEQAGIGLNEALPQIHIKARFLEVPKGTLDGLKDIISITNQFAASNQVAGLVGILTDKNFRTVLHSLEARPGVKSLAEPEVVTTSGRQTQMRATLISTIITNFVFEENATNGRASVTPQTSQIETGPVLDVVPYALSDGYTINLKLIPSLTEFLGYDQTTNTAATYNRAGEKIDLPVILPSFRVRQTVATLNLRDNQTVLLKKLEDHSIIGAVPPGGVMIGAKPVVKDNEVLVFITATLVDPAGNRVHADDE